MKELWCRITHSEERDCIVIAQGRDGGGVVAYSENGGGLSELPRTVFSLLRGCREAGGGDGLLVRVSVDGCTQTLAGLLAFGLLITDGREGVEGVALAFDAELIAAIEAWEPGARSDEWLRERAAHIARLTADTSERIAALPERAAAAAPARLRRGPSL